MVVYLTEGYRQALFSCTAACGIGIGGDRAGRVDDDGVCTRSGRSPEGHISAGIDGEAARAAWIDRVSKARAAGCGHLRNHSGRRGLQGS